MRDTPVLVTGATGFIGSRLAARLAGEEGARVTGVGRDLGRVKHLRNEGVDLVAADLRRDDDLPDLVRGKDVVFHAAAILSGDPETAEAVNVDATAELARLAAKAGVRRFVLVSTVGAYDMDDRSVVDESTPLAVDHRATYPRTKARAEERAFGVAAGTDLEVVVVRPSMVYGPGSGMWTELMARNVCEGKPVFLGDGSAHFNPVYLDDVVEALVLCATSERAAGEAFNVSAAVTTWRAFMDHYGELCGKEPKGFPVLAARLLALANRIPGVDTGMSAGFIEMATARKEFPVDKAREVLGWRPTVGLDEGMRRTLAWLRENTELGSGGEA